MIIPHIVIDERFWVAVSFVIFCAGAYPIFKKFFLKTLDNKIDDIKKSIELSEQLVKETSQKIINLEEQLRLQKQQSSQQIEKAKITAEKIHKQSLDNVNLIVMELKKSNEQKLAQMSKDYKQKIYTSVINDVYDNVLDYTTKNPKNFNQLSWFKKFDFSKFI
jgi:F0F1-type ATP synthase membrane subunit b/b'